MTALAFYFGVRRQALYANYFGIDTSLLGFSTQDYLLRSLDVLYRVLVLVVLMGLVALWLHVAITRGLRRAQARAVLRWTARVAAVVSAGFVAIGAGAMFGLPFNTPFLFGPASLGLGTTMLAYSTHLDRRIRVAEHGVPPRTREERRLATVTRTLFALLVVLSLFWATQEFAEGLGRGAALRLAEQLDGRPSAVVYSSERLQLEGPGVHETRLDPTDAIYRFRYSGLRLLIRSGGNYFLLPDGWTRNDGNVIVLPDDRTLRFEFTMSTP